MNWLVDANVLSEPTRPHPSPLVIEWLGKHQGEIAVSPIVLGEIEYGVLQLPSGRKRTQLQQWFESGVSRLKLVEIDARTASIWAELLAQLKRRGKAMPVKDSLIAASAIQHGLTVVTHNIADFRHSGVTLLDPFAAP
jgi:predicted nucleic acid-binding protein